MGNGLTNTYNCGDNRNLLDNWDFTVPVNQRKLTEYRTNGNMDNIFCLDRWHILNGVVVLKPRYIVVSNMLINYDCVLYQELSQDVIEWMKGKTVTATLHHGANSDWTNFSCYIPPDLSNYTDTRLGYAEFKVNNNNNAYIDLWCYKDSNNVYHIQYRFGLPVNQSSGVTSYDRLYGAKLEIGSKSTFMFDTRSIWYAQEMKKCLQYLYYISPSTNSTTRAFGTLVGHNSNTVLANIPLPKCFLDDDNLPILIQKNLSNMYVFSGINNYYINSIAISGNSGSYLSIDFNTSTSGIEVGKGYSLQMPKDSYIYLSREF